MIKSAFDSEEWVERFGSALEDIAPTAEYLVPIERNNSHWLTYNKLRELQALAISQSGINSKPEPSDVRLFSDPTEQCTLLHEHPILRCAIQGPDGDEHIRFLNPDTLFSIDAKGLISSLVKHAVKTSGKCAAQLLNRYLTEGEVEKLEAREFVVVYGLKIAARIELCDGASLVPLDNQFITEEGFSGEEAGRLRRVGVAGQKFQGGSGGSSVIVRDLTWGPGVAREPDGKHTEVPKTQYLYPLDTQIAIDFLSVVACCPVVTTTRHIRIASWTHDINPNFSFGWWGGGGFITDGWWEERELPEDKATAFHSLIAGFTDFQGPEKNQYNALTLAIGRIASSFSRIGRMQTQDMILDCAIALEILYKLDGSELSYKLGTRAAYLLGNTPQERMAIFNKIKDFYKIRSAIVHGNRKHNNLTSEKLEKVCADGQALVHDTLSNLLQRGNFPDWEQLVVEG